MYEEDGKKEKDLLAMIGSLLPEMTETEIESHMTTKKIYRFEPGKTYAHIATCDAATENTCKYIMKGKSEKGNRKIFDKRRKLMKKYYFTFGNDDSKPYKGGWVVVVAPTLKAAMEVFKLYYPDPVNYSMLNCSDYYTEEQFKITGMSEVGNYGAFCHEVIGPQTYLLAEFEETCQKKISRS